MTEILSFLPAILAGYTAFLLAIISPGPNFVAILGTSMEYGRKEGMALGSGISIGSLCWGTLAVSGISVLIASYASLLVVIKILGGLYLLWLASKAFRQAFNEQDITAKAINVKNNQLSRFFRRGFIIQITNPKAALAWIAIASLGVQAGAPLWSKIALVAGCVILAFAVHFTYALAFSTQPALRFYKNSRRIIQGAMGTFFTLAGLKLLTTKI